MDYQNYLDELQELEKRYKKDKSALAKKFAFSNNPIKEGDMVTDGRTTIKVEKIFVSTGFLSKIPECVYEGIAYTKKGQPKKNNQSDTVFQTRVIKINGEPV